jgi:hypothetical protein
MYFFPGLTSLLPDAIAKKDIAYEPRHGCCGDSCSLAVEWWGVVGWLPNNALPHKEENVATSS